MAAVCSNYQIVRIYIRAAYFEGIINFNIVISDFVEYFIGFYCIDKV